MALAVFSIKMVPRSSAITNLTKRKKKNVFKAKLRNDTHSSTKSRIFKSKRAVNFTRFYLLFYFGGQFVLRNNNSFCKQPRMLMTNCLEMNACRQQKLAHFSPYKDKEKKSKLCPGYLSIFQ